MADKDLQSITFPGLPDRYKIPFFSDVKEAVDDWLTEHPEATTTVQDGSVTEAKLANSLMVTLPLTFDTVADMQADTKMVTGQLCKITGECYSGYDASNITFIVSNTNNTFGISLASGLYAVPFTGALPTDLPSISVESANAIIDTALSYVDRSDFTYGHDGIFAEEVATPLEIDCSTLVQAAFMGISYDKSRYVNGTNGENLPEYWGYQFPTGLPSSLQSPIHRKYGFLANELAFYFYAHGLLYKINDGASNVQAGDIVFEEYSDHAGFLNIGHTGIVMQNDGKGVVRIIEGGYGQGGVVPVLANYTCAIRAYECGPETPFKWGARIPIAGGHASKDVTALINNIKGLSIAKSASNTFIFRTVVTEKIQKGKLYYIEINSNLSEIIQAAKSAGITYKFTVSIESLTESPQNIDMHDIDYLIDGSSTIISFTPLRYYDTHNILRFTITANLSGYTWDITNASIWRGMPLDIELGEANIVADSGITINSLLQRKHKIYMDVSIASIASGMNETTIGTIDLTNSNYFRVLGTVLCFNPAKFLNFTAYMSRGSIKLVTTTSEAVTNIRFLIVFDLDTM